MWLDSKNIQLTTKAAKLDNQRLRPFPIKARVSEWAYELELPEMLKVHPVFYVGLLSKVMEDIHRPFVKWPPPETIEGEEEYEVEAILECKHEKGKWWCFVKWNGYGLKSNQWEPRENLKNTSESVKKFHAKQLKRAHDSAKGL